MCVRPPTRRHFLPCHVSVTDLADIKEKARKSLTAGFMMPNLENMRSVIRICCYVARENMDDKLMELFLVLYYNKRLSR